MIRKRISKFNLENFPAKFKEIDNLSPNFINITFIDNNFTAGKNLFKYKPNYDRLSKDFPLQFEILDVNGNTLPYEQLNYTESDGSKVFVIYVYENVPVGAGKIIISATTKFDLNLNEINPRLVTRDNYLYTHNISIDNTRRNDAEMIYLSDPVFVAKEKETQIVEEKFSTPSKVQKIYGTGSYLYVDQVPTFIDGERSFGPDVVGGTIIFPSISNEYTPDYDINTSPFVYSSSISDIVTAAQIELESSLIVSQSLGGNSGINRRITFIQKQPYELEYVSTPSERNITQNLKPYAQIDISNMEPKTGHVTRVKVFYKSANQPSSEYQLAYDSDIEIKNLLVDNNTQITEYPFGLFKGVLKITNAGSSNDYVLNPLNYWTVKSLNDAPPANKFTSSRYIADAVYVVPTRTMSGSQELLLEQTSSSSVKFYTDTQYTIKFDYYLNADNPYDFRSPQFEVYMGGDAFIPTNKIGKYIGSSPKFSGSRALVYDYTLPITPDLEGDGYLKFVLRDGVHLSNIRIVEDIDRGFTPNRTRLFVPIKTEHQNEYLDFKIQFLNYTLKEANRKFSTFGNFFKGGNTYIGGDKNVITGSTYVSNATGSGIKVGTETGGSSGTITGSNGGLITGSTIKTTDFDGVDTGKKDLEESSPLYYYTKFDTEWNHSAFVRADGTLWTWGEGNIGQLGHNDTINRSSPTQVGTDKNWKWATVGASYTMAIKDDGTLWAWGLNADGQLGLDDITERSSPTQVGTLKNWYHVHAGRRLTTAIKRDGTLWTWGLNGGSLGDNTVIDRSSPVQVGTDTNWKKVVTIAGGVNTIGIKNNGTLWSWGQSGDYSGHNDSINRSTPGQIGGSTDWVDLSANIYHTLLIKSDGTMWTWGDNQRGQLGQNDTINRSLPTQIGSLKTWVSASAGGAHSVAIKRDGTIWAWGENGSAQLGDNTFVNKSVPIQIGTGSNWHDVQGGSEYTLGLTRDGVFSGWGYNNSGELGLNTSTTYYPVQETIITSSVKTVTSSNFGWSLNTGDVFKSGSSAKSVSMINENGSVFDFSSQPSSVELVLAGNNNRFFVGNDKKTAISWDGTNLILNDVLINENTLQLNDGIVSSSTQIGNYDGIQFYDTVISGTTYLSNNTSNGIVIKSLLTQSDVPYNMYEGIGSYFWNTYTQKTSGSSIHSYGYSGIEYPKYLKSYFTESNYYGWSLTYGNPHASGIGYAQKTVQMINESGSRFDFRATPASFDFYLLGSGSNFFVGNSGSSYIKWDGSQIIIFNANLSSSFAENAFFAYTSSYSFLALTSSYAVTSSYALSSSYAISASYAPMPQLADGIVSSSQQTLYHLTGTSIVSSSNQKNILGLSETDSPRFANLVVDGNLTANQYIVSSSVYIVTQSFSSGSTIFGNDISDTHQFTGSVYVSGSIYLDGISYGTASYSSYALSSSFAQTASYVLNSVSSSHSLTSSYAQNASTASYILNGVSSSYALSASFAQTASYVLNAVSSSFAQNSSTASYILNAVSSSYAENSSTASYILNGVSSSYSLSSSYSQNASTASYVLSGVSSSYALSASFAQTSSYILNAVSSSFAQNSSTASYVLNAVSASYSLSSSFATNSSTASYILNAVSSSYSLSSSYSQNASTASYVLNAVSASYSLSSSFATTSLTSSYVNPGVTLFASGAFTGSFTGSFLGTNNISGSFIGLTTSASYVQVFESSGTWNKPSWVRKITVICVGSGGAGGPGFVGGTGNRTGGGGGGGGSVSWTTFRREDLPSNSYNITVGSRGDASGSNDIARNGKISSFGFNSTPYIFAFGGSAGQPGSNITGSVRGGVPISSTVNSSGGGPGGCGQVSYSSTMDAASVPFATNTIPVNGSNAIPAAVAPTGGGGGAGLTSTGIGTTAGMGGQILESQTFNGTTINGTSLLNNSVNLTSAPSMSFYGTSVGLGGRGGRTSATAYKPVNGGKYGGGGGGGVAHPNGLYGENLGGFGGPGVVIVISEA